MTGKWNNGLDVLPFGIDDAQALILVKGLVKDMIHGDTNYNDDKMEMLRNRYTETSHPTTIWPVPEFTNSLQQGKIVSGAL